uniref:Neurobeachin-like n=1 Tax=Dermatophagoides pteronyssinus TaxID=6956 RepID=A0A6P6Y3U7_DERPT|nr:neurobeachin-like [Dermatophagoides pteronyssinus]
MISDSECEPKHYPHHVIGDNGGGDNIDDNDDVDVDEEEADDDEEEDNVVDMVTVDGNVESQQKQQQQQQQNQKRKFSNSFYTAMNEVLNDPISSDEVKFGLLYTKILAVLSNHQQHPNNNNRLDSIPVNEINFITDNILKLLITEDLQRIRKPETLRIFFCDYLEMLPSKVVAEILSVIIAVLKKSLLNLEYSKDLLLIAITQTFNLDNLIKHFIREIINLQTTYSCNVKELLAILKLSEEDPRLLHYIRAANLQQRNRPTAFFAFPGSNGSVLALPPFQKWPQQNGWTFLTWFRIESNQINSQPYLYYFRTSKSGVGYSAHFTGNCLVLTSMKIKGKGFQHCIPYEFQSQKWYHCAITYLTKWRSAEMKVYVNGQLTANTEMAWQVQTNDHFDKCFIGGTPDLNDTYLFSGQIASIYLFNEALNPSQICSIHRLGPSYIGQFRHSNESQMELPAGIRRVLYEEKLSSSIFCLYTPVAVESDTLCLQCLPKNNCSYFISSPHAALIGQAKSIQTHSISSTLQSIGGISALLPLLYKFAQKNDSDACSTLIGFTCDLLEFSPQWFGNEMIQSHGFVTIASILSKNARLLINNDTLDVLLNLTKTLISTSNNNDVLILKQILDNILFNASLWIYVDAKIQMKLYCYLSNEFLNGACSTTSGNQMINSNTNPALQQLNQSNQSQMLLNGIIFNEVRRISTVLQLLHSLKYYYWLMEEKSYNVKAQDFKQRPNQEELETIRSYILLFIKQLIIKGNGIHLDELQAILNYLVTVNQDLNIIDVLQMLQSLMCEHPASLIPAFDAKHGVQTIFKLLNSTNEEIRIQALKLLGYFLSRSTPKRKQDVMGPNNLYMLLCEHLIRFTPLTLNTYNALFEILTETSIESIRLTSSSCNSMLKIENSMILKVIATLLIEGKQSQQQQQDSSEDRSSCGGGNNIKEIFINDLWSLLINNRENRRFVLQMSVWQNWLINLIDNIKNELITNQILAIFRILLYHAIKYEYGGWRVWIDTLAIIHAKISYDDFCEQFGKSSRSSTSASTSYSTNNHPSIIMKNMMMMNNKNLENIKASLQVSSTKTHPIMNANNDAVDDDTIVSDGQQDSKIQETNAAENVNHNDESDNNESHPVPAAAICTISSIENESSTNNNLPSNNKSVVEEDNENTDNDEKQQTTSAPSNDSVDVAPSRKFRNTEIPKRPDIVDKNDEQSTIDLNKIKISATPAFRIPEFRWSNLHLKLLNDLLYSIEIDLQTWRNQSVEFKLDSSASLTKTTQIDQVLQNNDNQIYIVNTIHLISQLCDNVIIASGGLLPLLASATGGGGGGGGNGGNATGINPSISNEGFTQSQANFLLYKLANLIDVLCFVATHVNFNELEAEKNMAAGGILRQCLRIVCTIAVKNCLLIQRHENSLTNSSAASVNDSSIDFELISPNEYLYKGISIVSSAELFNVDFNPAHSDLIHCKTTDMDIDNLHYHLITPIKDPNSLLQEMDINRLRACIYRDADSDPRQSQFLALATLYFISVLMVSKYRDIIEPKNNVVGGGDKSINNKQQRQSNEVDIQTNNSNKESDQQTSIESIEITKTTKITEKLTNKLEQTLSSICPLLREIICDFSSFLSKTLLGSHGQELITKETIRTFKRQDASPVELVMLLCSQEWQNTLQKNAGLAFIELINEGRLLSHAMKDHIVRVAMEAEFILNRLRADDVSKHDAFTQSCIETNNSRLQEENIINSLIISAKRRDWMIFTRFKESIKQEERKYFKLDSWEDDCRRRRRFIYDSLGEFINLKLKSINVVASGIVQHETINENHHDHHNDHDNDTHKSLSSPIVPPRSLITNSAIDDEDNDSYLWDMNTDDNIGDTETSTTSTSTTTVEFSSSVLFSVECCLIWAIYTIEGVLQITSNEIFFEPNNNNDIDLIKFHNHQNHQNDKRKQTNDSSFCYDSFRGLSGIGPKGVKEFKDWDLVALQYCDLLTYNCKVSFPDIRAIFTRRYLLQPNALEIFLAQRTSIMFAFSDYETVKKVVRYLPAVGVGVKYGIPQSRRGSLMTPKQLFASSNMTQRWQKREISNFEYLMFLNTIAGRSYQDLNQYPIFPWILTNYESKDLDLSQPTNFRDLSKPIGALNSERREEFIERFNQWDNNQVPAFHYGTHYSTAAFTLSWLIRIQPFFSIYLSIQDGLLEDRSRLFTSIRDSWVSSLMGGQQNVKELIPEFFFLPEIFHRNNLLKNVKLPPWADTPESFIRLHRMALESDLVSCQLHQWIDLIFGYKQRGPEAVRAVNVFYYLTYEGNIDLSSIGDQSIREAIETQIRHFGQTPSQLTTDPHPPRSSALHVSPLMFTSSLDELCANLKFPFNSPIVHVAPCTGSLQSNQTSVIVTINQHQQYFLHKWNSKDSTNPLIMDSNLQSNNSTTAKRQLMDTNDLCCSNRCNYVVTMDAKYIILCPFYDNSFRVYSTETGRITQIVYGHKSVVTCIARSECNIVSDFYVCSGSQDCSVLLWTWNAKYSQIEGNGCFHSSNPLPKLTLCGHQSPITSLLISAELGIIVSSSLNKILIHTTTQGECISEIDFRYRHSIGTKDLSYGDINETDLRKLADANIEASMLGRKGFEKLKSPQKNDNQLQSNENLDENHQQKSNNKINNKEQQSLMDDNDYIITNLNISRELGFIIGIASSDYNNSSRKNKLSKRQSQQLQQHKSYLFSYNLKGLLIKSMEIHSNAAKDKDNCILQTTRDGEYIIFTENGNTIKILRTFDLIPLYAFNTDSSSATTTINDQQLQPTEKIRSLSLVDFKYILVGMENGKLLVYNIDFNRWNHEYNNRF